MLARYRQADRECTKSHPLSCAENYFNHFQDLTSELCDLEGKIFDAYIEQKAEPLLAYVEPGLTMGDFKWHNCLPPKGNVLQLGSTVVIHHKTV